jgi:DNA-damage-inducible protein J
MARSAHVNARIDAELKAKAERIFAAIGLRASDAITMFYRQAVLRRGLPFDACIPNETTIAAMRELEHGGGKVHRGRGRDVVNSILHE